MGNREQRDTHTRNKAVSFRVPLPWKFVSVYVANVAPVYISFSHAFIVHVKH